MRARPLHDRRHADRPRTGDTKPCPKCSSPGCYEFNDRYRFGDIGTAPGWICGCPPCRYRELVRRADRRLAGQVRALQTRAKRQMLKCEAPTEPSLPKRKARRSES